MLIGLLFLKVQAIYQFPLGIVLNTLKALYMLLGSWIFSLILCKIPIVKKLFEF